MNLRLLAAIAILVQGAVHAQQYLSGFSGVPLIGPLFLLNAIVSVPIAIWLVKDHRIFSILAGAGLLIGSIASLMLATTTDIFGYVLTDYGWPEITALVAEVIGLTALVIVTGLSWRGSRPALARN